MSQKREAGEEQPTLNRSCSPELWLGSFCWGFCGAGLFFQVMAQSGILGGWQKINSLKGICFPTCHFYLQCFLTNRGGIGVPDVGSGFSRQIFWVCAEELPEDSSGLPLCLSCGVQSVTLEGLMCLTWEMETQNYCWGVGTCKYDKCLVSSLSSINSFPELCTF